ncbi:MAG TPA: sodium:solute symporter family protein [Desulfuromonadales bacterium]|nr:sodium:solute symporter family protein [Desulfuromonadales bacterium]
MPLSAPFLLTFLVTLAALAGVAFARRGQVRSAADFAVAGRSAGSWRVSGAIMGTLVGGASTIGTAQMAYLYGLSGWWFTLGAGLACLFLALTLAGPLRTGEVETAAGYIAGFYGNRARSAASLFTSLGMFIHIVAQLLACGALLASLFDLPRWLASPAAALLIALVAVGGGMRTAGAVGLAKMLLLYAAMLGAGWLALRGVGGWTGLRAGLPETPWFSLFGYGVAEGLSDLLSMLVGVVTTQIYLQAVFSARDVRAARSGALLSALLIPPLGLCGIAVGLNMRLTRPGLDSAQVLPAFILEQFSPLWAGAAFAALLFAAVATAAGLALGVGTTLQADLLPGRPATSDRRLRRLRLATLGAVLAALLIVIVQLDSLILRWSFLSMGLRGATLFVPLLGAVFLGVRAPRRAGALAIGLGPAAVVAGGLFGWPSWPPLYLGLGVALLVWSRGFLWERR